jgi:PTH2 family peptidyl-tRNA hydrolase
MKTKMVIVMRKDLKMRKGKMIAQGAHAALGAILQLANKTLNHILPNWEGINRCTQYKLNAKEGTPLREWLDDSFRKIAVSVDCENALLLIRDVCEQEHINVCMITDNGLTEFNGVKTNTCLAIGPDEEDKIDKITGDLPLL